MSHKGTSRITVSWIFCSQTCQFSKVCSLIVAHWWGGGGGEGRDGIPNLERTNMFLSKSKARRSYEQVGTELCQAHNNAENVDLD